MTEIQTAFNGYSVTSTGEVISYKHGKRRVIKQAVMSAYKHCMVSLCVDGVTKSVLVHRLIWEAFNGSIPSGMEIDHIDRNPSNNRIDNLRIATRLQNSRNNSGHSKSRSRHAGVTYHSRLKKWQASIRVNKQLLHLGYFDNEQAAISVRKQAAEKHFGEFAPR